MIKEALKKYLFCAEAYDTLKVVKINIKSPLKCLQISI